jgi:hypothetical protein
MRRVTVASFQRAPFRLRFPLLMRLMAEAEPAFLIKRIVPD